MVVYFHRNPKTLEIFYVGIGRKRRAFESGGRNKIWQNYVKKHGERVVEIVHEGIDKEQAYALEVFYIKKFGLKKDGGSLVNITLGGESNPMHIDSCVEKVRRANIGKRASDETRAKQSLAKKNKPSNQPKGYRHSEEVVQKMKLINKEIVNRPDVKSKLRLSMLGKRNTAKHKSVLKIHPVTNELIQTYECAMDAGREFGKPNTGNIASVCNGRRPFAFGYKWSYAS